MSGEIIFKTLIVVAVFLSFIFIWINGDPDDYSFMTGILGDKEKHESDVREGMELSITEIRNKK